MDTREEAVYAAICWLLTRAVRAIHSVEDEVLAIIEKAKASGSSCMVGFNATNSSFKSSIASSEPVVPK